MHAHWQIVHTGEKVNVLYSISQSVTLLRVLEDYIFLINIYIIRPRSIKLDQIRPSSTVRAIIYDKLIVFH